MTALKPPRSYQTIINPTRRAILSSFFCPSVPGIESAGTISRHGGQGDSNLRHHLAQRRSFTTTRTTLAGGKNKIRVSNKGKFKDHPLGGPGMEEAFDIERDLSKPFAMQDVPGVTHLEWAEARKRLNKLRSIKFQMPSLSKFQQPFVPPPPHAHVIVKVHDDMGFHRGQLDSQRPNRKVTIQVNLSKIPGLKESPQSMHKFKLLSGKRWFESEPKSEFDLNDHYDDPHGMIKISCDDYPTQQLNQKWCSDTLDRLIQESLDLKSDPMNDIPLDHRPTIQRRHRNKHRPWSVDPTISSKFPKEWLPGPIKTKLESFQELKRSSLIDRKNQIDRIDRRLRELIGWDGVGLTPIGLFNHNNKKLDPAAKLQVDQLVQERQRIRDASDHLLGRNSLKNFLLGAPPSDIPPSTPTPETSLDSS